MPTLPRLYAILDVDLAARHGRRPDEVCEAWLQAGVRLVQLRAKSLSSGGMLELADRLAAQIRAAGGQFVVNDRLDVALLSGAGGVHVGQEDLTPSAVARVLAGPPARPPIAIGLSTHNEAQVRAGLDEPVSYLAIGPVFATTTKDRPDPVVGLAGVTRAAGLTGARGVPLVAIGGIDQTNAAAVIAAGATAVAVAADLTRDNPARRAEALLRVLGG